MADQRSNEIPVLQQFILAVLAASRPRMTLYELATRCGWKPSTIYDRIKRPTSSDAIARMFAVLGIEVRSGSLRVAFTLQKDGQVAAKRKAR